MKNALLVIFAVSLIFIKCSKDSPTSAVDDTSNNDVVVKSIGSNGGSIVVDSIEVSVPPNALNNSTNLTISINDNNELAGESLISKSYLLEGLPDNYSQPITIKIKSNADNPNESFIAVGIEEFVKSKNSVENSFTMLDTYKSGNDLVCQLLVPDISLNKLNKIEGESISLFLQAVSGKSYTSSFGHFEISYSSLVSQQAINNLADYLEEAYSKFSAIGFDYSGRTKWPVKVTVRNLGQEDFGHSVSSVWGDNYGYLEFNSLKINDSESMRLTAGHEFFHLVQGLYDKRNRFSKAKFAPPHLWIDEAAAVWAEEKFTSQNNYISSIRDGHTSAPYKGMGASPLADAQSYGYGMSALIKYFQESKIVSIYNKIKAGSHPVEAILLSNSEPASYWWPDFINQYTEGKIYDDIRPLTLASDEQTQLFEINSSSDSLKIFETSCKDLSAALFNIKLKQIYFEPGTKLKINLTPDANLSLTLYKYKGESIEKLTSGNEITVGELQTLKDQGWYLLAVVTNDRWLSPYTGSKSINLKVSIQKDETIDLSKYKYCQFGIFYSSVLIEDSNGSTFTTTRNFIFPYDKTEGSFSGNTFTAVWDIQTGYPKRKGEMRVTVDPSTLTASSVYYTEIIDDNASFTTFVIEASNIAMQYYANNPPSTLSGQISGNDVCGSLSNFTYDIVSQTSGYWSKAKSIQCADNTSFTIVFKEY